MSKLIPGSIYTMRNGRVHVFKKLDTLVIYTIKEGEMFVYVEPSKSSSGYSTILTMNGVSGEITTYTLTNIAERLI